MNLLYSTPPLLIAIPNELLIRSRIIAESLEPPDGILAVGTRILLDTYLCPFLVYEDDCTPESVSDARHLDDAITDLERTFLEVDVHGFRRRVGFDGRLAFLLLIDAEHFTFNGLMKPRNVEFVIERRGRFWRRIGNDVRTFERAVRVDSAIGELRALIWIKPHNGSDTRFVIDVLTVKDQNSRNKRFARTIVVCAGCVPESSSSRIASRTHRLGDVEV